MTELSKDNKCYECRWCKFMDESFSTCENPVSEFFNFNINKQEIKECDDFYSYDDNFMYTNKDDGGLL